MNAELKMPDPAKAKEYFRDKMAFTTGPVELDRAMKEENEVIVIDVRAVEDYEKGHIPGAINLPRERWGALDGQIDRDSINVLYCYSHVCHLAATAALQFASEGFPVMEMDGGWEAWKQSGLPVEKGLGLSRTEARAAAAAA